MRYTNGYMIDHIAFLRKLLTCFTDVNVMRGAILGFNHNLILRKIQRKLKSNWKEKTQSRLRLSTTLLVDPAKKEEFQIALQNKFQVPKDPPEDTTVEGKW